MNQFSSKVILITGSSCGIGECLAKAFAKEGANLVITGRNEDNLCKVENECKDLGAEEVLKVIADLTMKENMEMLMNETIDKFERLDVLVNNAGITVVGGLRDVTLEAFDKSMDINFKTPLYLTQLAIPHLEKTKGNIVNISSTASTGNISLEYFGYLISKTSLDRLTKIAALELSSSGIRVNSVNPGACDTPMLRGYAKDLGIEEEELMKVIGEKSPLHQRVLQVQEVIDAVMFLASDKASMITGTNLLVDGGRLL